jgi:hypothetical protein
MSVLLHKAIFLVTHQLFGCLTTLFYKSDWCSGNTLDLFLGGAHPKTQLEHWLLWQISMILLSFYRQMLGWYLNCVITALFQILSNSSFIQLSDAVWSRC